MNRRDLFKRTAAFGLAAGTSYLAATCRGIAGVSTSDEPENADASANSNLLQPLTPPATGSIPAAFVVSKGAVVIDFCGPWEVFQDAGTAHGENCFAPYLVAETADPVIASAGLTVLPNFTFQTAPAPKIIVIPAQLGGSPAMLDWIRTAAKTADLTMSVCTGASILGRTGLLAGRAATTHHGAYTEFAAEFPGVRLQHGARFVEDGKFASSGGLSSGIDLALRVVERYYGRARAEQVAGVMEYQGQGWLDPNSNQVYAKERASTDEHPLCPVCSMDADRTLKSVYQGKDYYFCMQPHKDLFDATPTKFAVHDQTK